MNTVEVLVAARALIEDEENWGQGMRAFRDRPHTSCVAEAVESVTNLNGIARRASYEALVHQLPRHCPVIVDWNDAKGRTHAEVLNLFDRAIAAEQKKVAA